VIHLGRSLEAPELLLRFVSLVDNRNFGHGPIVTLFWKPCQASSCHGSPDLNHHCHACLPCLDFRDHAEPSQGSTFLTCLYPPCLVASVQTSPEDDVPCLPCRAWAPPVIPNTTSPGHKMVGGANGAALRLPAVRFACLENPKEETNEKVWFHHAEPAAPLLAVFNRTCTCLSHPAIPDDIIPRLVRPDQVMLN
jgi:hypothetical protein